ncbi:MAG: HlyD family efflux transporter periplasmic adaptor subunit [Verrucomicrobiae bacterium]|nr:HlyD family efflux transporter periplasmic adaptor subunit [Verrucomicrobiae bacterium]
MKSPSFSLVILALVLGGAFAIAQEKSSAPRKLSPSEEKTKAPDSKPDPGKKDAAKPDEKEKDKEKPDEPATHTVKKGPFAVTLELDGLFEAAEATEISLAPEAWGDLTVLEFVPHGTRVKKGDAIARFDTEKLEEQLDDYAKGLPLAELTLDLARQELEALEKTTPLSLDEARRSKMFAEQDLAHYEDVEKKMDERDSAEDVKALENYLAYSREELNQLEKMYEADDMTEETEEIILKRARDEVARYEWMLEQTRTRAERRLNTFIPREHESMRLRVESQGIAWRQAERGLPDALKKKRLEVEAQTRAFEKAARKNEELAADLKLLTVTAPHDGIVYYGQASRGKWVTAAMVERKLVPGGKVSPREILATLVKSETLALRASVPEAKLQYLKEGLKGIAIPASNPDAEFDTKVKSFSLVPYADNSFDAFFAMPEKAADSPVLNAGMNAKIHFDLHQNDNALTVPKKAVKREGADRFVYLKDGTKRKVKTGFSDEKVIEILDGLKEGDVVKL